MKTIFMLFFAVALYAQELVEFSDAVIDMRYASNNNFVGSKITGYKRAKCLLTPEAAKALKNVADALKKEGKKLHIYDCYRPQRAVNHFMRWAKDVNDTKTKDVYYPRVKKRELFEKGYIAKHSGHSRGSTIDLAIDAMDFGSPFDFFDPLSHTTCKKVSKQAQKNRAYLQKLMREHGFIGLKEEWWHFRLKDEPNREFLDRIIE